MKSPRPASILSYSIAALLLSGTAFAENIFWEGDVSNDWNDPGNWNVNRVPTAPDDAVVNNTPANVATISANVPAPRDIRVGESNTPGDFGTLFHTAGTLASGNGNWTAIGAGTATTTGVYNLTNATATAGNLSGFGQGSGTLNANGRLYVGGTDDTTSYGAGGIGTLNLNSSSGVFGTDTIYVGARGSTGTVNMDSGTLTTTGNRMFLGQEGGTGTVNVSGGTVSVIGDGANGRIHVGNGSIGFMNVGGTGNVVTTSDLIIGANGGTGTVNQAGGTMNIGGWAYVGGTFEGSNNTGNLNISGGSFNKGNGRLYIGVGQGATVGHMAVSGSGVFTNTEQFVVGTGTTTSTLAITGSGKVNTGQFNLGGNQNNDFGGVGNGAATVNGAGALLNVVGELQVARNAGSTGMLTISDGLVQSSGTVVIGQLGGTGTVNVNGATGALTGAGQVWVGQDSGSTATLNVSAGTVTSQSWLAVGRNGSSGILTISGTGVVQKSASDGFMELTNANVGGSAVVNLDGGSLIVNGIVGSGGASSTQTLNLNGGLLRANADTANYIDTADAQLNVFVKAGGARIDSDGHNITIGKPLLTDVTSTGGGLTKSGVGELRLTSGDNSYTGPTMVSGGTLNVAGSISGTSSVVVGNNAALLFGSDLDKINDGASVILQSGGTLNTGGFNEGPESGASGATAELGVLTLNANTTIDFGQGGNDGSTLLFAGLSYTPGDAVSILNWTGQAGDDFTFSDNDRLLFTSAVSFTDAQLASIQFFGDDGTPFAERGARQIVYEGYTELVAVPEPGVAVALFGGVAMMLGVGRLRRRLS